jgi:hypothetical protein
VATVGVVDVEVDLSNAGLVVGDVRAGDELWPHLTGGQVD